MTANAAPSQPAAEDNDDRAVDLGDLTQSVGLLLQIAQLVAREKQYALIKNEQQRAKVSEFVVLQAIDLNPGISQGLLADLFRISWPSMSRLIASLEKRDLLRRFVPPEDRRCVELKLTAAGQETVARQSKLMDTIDKTVFAEFSDAERQQFLASLRKIIGWKNVS